jgi:hypothetical protein
VSLTTNRGLNRSRAPHRMTVVPRASALHDEVKDVQLVEEALRE